MLYSFLYYSLLLIHHSIRLVILFNHINVNIILMLSALYQSRKIFDFEL